MERVAEGDDQKLMFRMGRATALGAAGLITMIVLTSCRARVGEGDGEHLSWDQPIPGGVAVLRAEDAELAFQPDVPEGLGAPEAILATSQDHAAEADREIAWVFQHPTYSRFVIVERLVDESATEGEWADLASATPGCETISEAGVVECHYGKRSIVTIRNTTSAFMLEGNATTAIHWLEGVDAKNQAAFARYRDPAVEVVVLGPASDFTAEEAIDVANAV